MPTHPRHSARSLVFAALGIAALASAARASIVNPSFEDVYPSPLDPYFMLPVGWNTFEMDGWDTSWAGQYDDYMPPWITPSDGQLMGINSYVGALRQSVTLSAGDIILVDVAMATGSSMASGAAVAAVGSWEQPWWNSAALATFEVPWNSGFGTFGVAWINWQTLTLTVPATGTYDLILLGAFGGNTDGVTHTYFDNIRVIPAPGAVALLVLGGPVAASRRR